MIAAIQFLKQGSEECGPYCPYSQNQGPMQNMEILCGYFLLYPLSSIKESQKV